jgi:hypothetical protein
VDAIKRFMDSIREVRWVTDVDAATMAHIFQRDQSAVNAYMAIDNENIQRLWVLQSLREGGA